MNADDKICGLVRNAEALEGVRNRPAGSKAKRQGPQDSIPHFYGETGRLAGAGLRMRLKLSRRREREREEGERGSVVKV